MTPEKEDLINRLNERIDNLEYQHEDMTKELIDANCEVERENEYSNILNGLLVELFDLLNSKNLLFCDHKNDICNCDYKDMRDRFDTIEDGVGLVDA